jgi:phage-related protein
MKAQFVFEKFDEVSDPVHDMSIGSNVNFKTEALKTIQNDKIKDFGKKRDKWQVFLNSLKGKIISGIFEQVKAVREKPFKKTNRITFTINDYNSYLNGAELYFFDKKAEATSSRDAVFNIYRVLPEENYLIK